MEQILILSNLEAGCRPSSLDDVNSNGGVSE